MPDLLVKLHPLVLRLLEHGQGRWREGRVGKGADRHPDPGRCGLGLPKDGRTACWAKMHSHLAPAVSSANEFLGRSGNLDAVDRVERIGAEWRASSSLTSQTVTQRGQLRRFARRQSKSATGALGSGHGKSSRWRGENTLEGRRADPSHRSLRQRTRTGCGLIQFQARQTKK
ncbi:hypothetical protein D9M69_145260 [compost metagenome]